MAGQCINKHVTYNLASGAHNVVVCYSEVCSFTKPDVIDPDNKLRYQLIWGDF